MQVKNQLSIGVAALALIGLGAVGQAQMAGGGMPGGPRGAPPAASKDPAAAVAGSYAIDPQHAAVIARIAHGGGMSWSAFRFTGVQGTLDWNPADPAQSKLTAKVDMRSVTSAADGFAATLTGDRFLKTAQFPDATFVSNKIARTGPTTGRIDGNLTFLGVTKPATIEANLVGAGKDMRGRSAIGFSGTMTFKRSDFGFSAMLGMIGDEVQMTLDVELVKAA